MGFFFDGKRKIGLVARAKKKLKRVEAKHALEKAIAERGRAKGEIAEAKADLAIAEAKTVLRRMRRKRKESII